MTQLAHTCDLSHGVEDLQLLRVEWRHFVVVVAVERGRKGEDSQISGGRSPATGRRK